MLVERLVRALVVELSDEAVELALLRSEAVRWRPGGLVLERAVHALMTAILLRMARLNAFNADPQPEPPDGKLAQLEQGVGRSEGNAVIAADVRRQAALLEKPLKHGKGVVFAGGGESFATQQVALA